MDTLAQQAAAVAADKVSARDLVEAALDAIARTQPVLNAYTQVFADEAREAAKSPPDGPLRGVPIAVKDLYDLAGSISSGCCEPYAHRRADADSVVVAKLRAAGAIIVAKTNQHELACGATNLTSSYGATRNPWDRERITGGSSGGSGAAVGAGVVAMAMGSDTGGSIRIPSSFCGVTGLKPTHGSVSLRGAMPMCPSLDTAGPLARSAEDCLLVHTILVGPDEDYLWSRTGPRVAEPPKTIGIARSFFDKVHPETKRGIDDAAKVFESLGYEIVDVEGPNIDEAFAMFGTRLTEVAACYRDLWEDERISPGLQQFIQVGRSISGADAFSGRELGLKIERDFRDAFKQADVLLAPCTSFAAPKATDNEIEVDGGAVDVHLGGCARLTLPVNVAGLPAVAFPVGFSSANTPLGAQLIGRDWTEPQLCATVTKYQETTDWHLRTANVV
jgi:aspartyl-tRNA(Asn)/glutamyl-tRNA(Gln) amidotransferase subunit A